MEFLPISEMFGSTMGIPSLDLPVEKSLRFLDLGDPSCSVLVGELNISYYRGIAPTPLCRSYTPLLVPLCWQDGGWAQSGTTG